MINQRLDDEYVQEPIPNSCIETRILTYQRTTNVGYV